MIYDDTKSITVWIVQCDLCGGRMPTDEPLQEGAKRVARGAGWWTHPTKEWIICKGCRVEVDAKEAKS